MIVTTAQLFKAAYGKFAIGAYNINNLEQTVGLFRGNLESQAPFIIQLSKGARKYSDKRFLEGMIRAADQVFPEAVFAVHLDHGDEETCMDCIASGFYSSVMIDASHEPFEKNIEITGRVVKAAHAKGISVEAELGQLGGVEEDIVGSVKLTEPKQAAEFIRRTGCDSLAVAIGTSHGAFKFKAEPGKKLGLHFEVVQEIQRLVPGYPMVLHGSSSVPRAEVERINAAGGKLKDASGVPEEDLAKAGAMGVCKVNIDTDGRLVWTRVHREFFRDFPEKFDLRDVGKPFMEEYAKMIAGKNAMLGSAGKLGMVKKALGLA
ncbi:MAG: ketose-bisphosphate aldolase [Lentisphaerae bacterium]|nr:ketose-bisphosphate aldolase [Lentisphaerota bacterium]